jgi:metal-dependent amidase/aminoacylase/carboxypeptidase family protein
MGGKSEFLSRGYFDGVDIAFMVHTSQSFSTNKGSVGCIAKSITYKGKAAHAGGSPWNGNNALYAANCGINAVNAIRETFRDSDIIRVHPIITNGGAMVNAIPGEVKLESYVRGKTYEAITSANARVNRALIGAALSLGTNIEINDIPGYAPLVCDDGMIDIADRAMKAIMPGVEFKINDGYSSGSTDMGDLSTIMPVIHPYSGGAVGTSHGCDYYIADPEAACIDCAKWQLAILTLLLENGGAEARRIVSEFKPIFADAKEFLDYQDAIASEGARIEYSDGKAVVTL